MKQGVIYVATGAGYLDLARASAESLRAHNPGLAIDLFTDDPARPGLGLFDQVHPVPRVHDRAKLDCLGLSRFERTLYLDCDTLVVAPLGDLFEVLERFDLALAHEVRRNSALIREGHAVSTPYAFPQFNSGVLLYRRAPAMQAFLADWVAKYNAAGHARDQIVLKDLLWSSDLRFYVLPPEFNLRRVTMMDAWEPLDARPTILHSHRLRQHLDGHGASRVTGSAQLLAVERAALAAEWLGAGQAGAAAKRPGPPESWYDTATRHNSAASASDHRGCNLGEIRDTEESRGTSGIAEDVEVGPRAALDLP